jgi:hypothetical protein
MDTRVDPYREGAQVVSGDVSIGKTLPQCSPACICWSAVSTVRSTGVVVSAAKGTASRPSNLPLSIILSTLVFSPIPRWIAV